MNSTNKTQVFKLVRALRERGCMPHTPLATPRGALISIEQPTPEMARNATEIKQCLNGVETLVYTLRLEGCTVSWQGDYQCRTH